MTTKKEIKEAKKADLKRALELDPAATSEWQIKHTYAGYKALCGYRKAHWYWERGHKKIAEMISYRYRQKTNVEIHPGATIGKGIFIDHGAGIVIGETAVVGDNCILYQGVTLGGTGKQSGKRHPTLREDVQVSAGAKVLGAITIGEHSKIGANSVVIKDVPPYSTVVGVPGRVVKAYGKRIADMDQVLLPDPIMDEFRRIHKCIEDLCGKVGIEDNTYSITQEEYITSEFDQEGND